VNEPATIGVVADQPYAILDEKNHRRPYAVELLFYREGPQMIDRNERRKRSAVYILHDMSILKIKQIDPLS
jgi:hypothetical protein